jgi:hypothetical protein
MVGLVLEYKKQEEQEVVTFQGANKLCRVSPAFSSFDVAEHMSIPVELLPFCHFGGRSSRLLRFAERMFSSLKMLGSASRERSPASTLNVVTFFTFTFALGNMTGTVVAVMPSMLYQEEIIFRVALQPGRGLSFDFLAQLIIPP